MNRTLNYRASGVIHEIIQYNHTIHLITRFGVYIPVQLGFLRNPVISPLKEFYSKALLISCLGRMQAYLCLSDETKRRCFNMDRRKNICLKCSRVSHKTKENRNDSKPNRFCQTLRDIRDKFREENKVIERCLKTNSARFMGNRTEETPVYGIPNQNRFKKKESPVFNPSDYRLWGYPHVRNRVFFDNNLSDRGMFMRSRSTSVHSS